MDKSILDNPEKVIYEWWSKIRWFIVLVLFAIGILRIAQANQAYPTFLFIATFLGISILNILFHLQIVTPNNWIAALQITLDIVFATLVVHLTGGMHSNFVWIYLIAVITASLSIEKAGGFIAAMIGSLCMLLLIMMYNYGWLFPVVGSGFSTDIADQTIFLISYTALFSGVAFISSFISTVLKDFTSRTKNVREEILHKDQLIIEKQQELAEHLSDTENYKEVLKTAAAIAGIDHDINNPLTIISLSIRRIKKAASEYNDLKLSKTSDQMTEAINSINGILVRLQSLKRLEMIKEERNRLKG
ncbi:MAG: histidine kinase [Candidatus Cloacimonas sp. SDB]|nr:MAG: histidine kinase [Candidatus Cloacimonas sp. SDB]